MRFEHDIHGKLDVAMEVDAYRADSYTLVLSDDLGVTIRLSMDSKTMRQLGNETVARLKDHRFWEEEHTDDAEV